MASTNKTEHYNLSQFVPLDKPAWLGDYNSDMQKIDAGIYAAQSKADSLETNVEAASAAATAAQQAAQSATEAAQQASDKAQDAETTANGVAATASQALTTAQQAETTAQQAQNTANEVNTKISPLFTPVRKTYSNADFTISSIASGKININDFIVINFGSFYAISVRILVMNSSVNGTNIFSIHDPDFFTLPYGSAPSPSVKSPAISDFKTGSDLTELSMFNLGVARTSNGLTFSIDDIEVPQSSNTEYSAFIIV